MDRTKLARGLGVTVVLGLLASTAWTVRDTSSRVAGMDRRLAALDQKVQQLAESRKLQPLVAAAHDAARGARAEARAADAAGGAAKAARKAPTAGARDKTKGNAFAGLLDHLYQVADDLAEEEDWSPETYDRVSEIFEWTAGELTALQKQVVSKQVNAADAKQKALQVRDEAGRQLGEVLGPDAMARLKQAWLDDRAAR
jgi:hypothetical protein